MTNSVYPLWKDALMAELATNKSLDQAPPNNTALCLLTIGSGGYNYSDLHQFYTDLTGIQNVATALTTPTLTSNVFSADGLVFVGVTGTTIGALVIFRQNSGANSTWRLVLYEDTSIIGLPMVPNGGNLLVTWNTQGIFAL
jgi:hypothetical protein